MIDRSQRGNDKPSDHAPVMINLDLEETHENFENEDDDIFAL